MRLSKIPSILTPFSGKILSSFEVSNDSYASGQLLQQ